ncbi:MAG: BrnT family toxin [Limnobacter sp.]|nr:BrnT family toxin [Limnobacter sp.]
MSRMNTKIADALAMPGIAEIEFDPPRVTIEPQPVDFSEDRFLAQSCTEFYAIF